MCLHSMDAKVCFYAKLPVSAGPPTSSQKLHFDRDVWLNSYLYVVFKWRWNLLCVIMRQRIIIGLQIIKKLSKLYL